MVFKDTFNNISVISFMVVSFIGGGNRSTTSLPQVTEEKQSLLHNVVLSTWQ